MMRSNFKKIFRQALRNPLYSVINLFGLSAGIASCIIIFLFVENEFTYDRFHKNGDRVYRVNTQETADGAVRRFAHSYLPVIPLMQSQMPEIEEAVRLLPQSVSVANKERNILFQENKFCYGDSNFFNLFSFPLQQGDINTALKEPHNIVLTQAVAKKYFGDADPMGKELVIEQNTVFKVTGIFAEIPSQSSLQFDLLAPMAAIKDVWGPWIVNNNRTWHHPPVYSFVKLSSVSGINKAEQLLGGFEEKFLPPHIAKTRSHFFQKLSDIHFSNLENEPQPSINKKILYIFIAAGIVILFIAAFNFINLFLSRIVFRLRGVGIQKVVGAGNRHIWGQTLAESFFYLFTAFVLSALWVTLFLPDFNSLMNRNLVLFGPESLKVWLLLAALLLGTGFLISIVPSVILSRVKLINVLKGKNESFFPRRKVISLQSVFVVFQFIIAVVLIIATVVMQSQMHFIRNKDLGLKKEQVLVIPVMDETLQESFTVLKNKLSQVSGVVGVAAISNFPWEKGFYDFETTVRKNGTETRANAPTLLIEEGFIKTMGMTILKGRDFSKDFKTDTVSAFIMNETAAAQFGITDPQGVKLLMESVAAGKPKEGELIGIVKDFNLQSLHEVVQPLILTVAPESYYIDNIVVKLSSDNIPGTISRIESQVKEISPGRPFEYFFLDNAFEKLYQNEARVSTVFNYFSVLVIIIASLGLLGIVAFSAAQRFKEIGIRKVLGAPVTGLVALLTKDFLKLVIVAVLVASPVGWWIMNKWLQDFAYRISIEWWVFIVAAVTALLIALLTVSIQAIKAAVANPVKSLRTE